MIRIRLFVVLLLALAALGLHAAPTPALAAGICPGGEQDIVNAIASAGVGGTVSLSCPSATTIYFDTASGHNGTGGPITISQSVTLDASGSLGTITFDGGHTDQGGGVQLFTVNSGATLALNHLTLQHAFGSNFGGGAIVNFGTVTIASSTLAGNSASVPGAAIFQPGHAGHYQQHPLPETLPPPTAGQSTPMAGRSPLPAAPSPETLPPPTAGRSSPTAIRSLSPAVPLPVIPPLPVGRSTTRSARPVLARASSPATPPEGTVPPSVGPSWIGATT